jgi:hypothetical protein
MHVFDAPMHGKSMNLREFSSKYDPRTADVAADDCTTGAGSWTLFAWLFPVCTASAMTMVYGLRREATDWGPEAPVLHFFLAALLPLRIYTRLCFPEKIQCVWPSLVLHCIVMLFAYPYDVERVSGVVFCSVFVADCFFMARCVRGRSLAANAATLLLLANGVLSLVVHNAESRVSVSYYHSSFVLLCIAFLSF